MEFNSHPATISTTIIVAVMAATILVLFSAWVFCPV